MSTILDALRKVERERDPTSEVTAETPHLSVEVRRRRRFPLVPILICAIVGFGGGAILSWLMPAEQDVEVAALPAAQPPPAIPVPREPVRARPAAPAAPVEQAKQEAIGEAAAPPAPAAAAPPAVAMPPAPPPAAPGVPAAVAVAPNAPPPAAVPAPPAGAVPQKPAEAVAALAKQDSALEPSPFVAPGEPERDAAAPPAKVAAVPKLPPAPKVAPPPAEPAHDADIAAVPPAPPPAPDAALDAAAPPPEPEPETPAETLIDTGRSPPGSPKIALSFLQWSADPAKRFAFISIDGSPSQRVREGETAGSVTVFAITKTGVQFKRDNVSFIIRPRH